jgi:hypothetical protein
MVDTPTNNFCTLNPIWNHSANTLSEGNLKSSHSPTGYWEASSSTFGVSSGKWYFEFSPVVVGATIVGVRKLDAALSTSGSNSNQWGYYSNGTKKGNSAEVSYGSSWTSGDVIGVAIDVDAGTLSFYKNNSSLGEAFNNLSAEVNPYIEFGSSSNGVANFGQDSSFAGNKTTGSANANDGNYGDFYYTPPSGFLALCTSNLTAPAVKPQENFNTVLYPGDNNATKDITGVGFQPDFVWLKRRNGIDNHQLSDVVRGVNASLMSDSAAIENTTAGQYFTAFGTDGFTVGTNGAVNASGGTYVSWNWKAGGTASTISAGAYSTSPNVPSIASSVSANADAGFSIVSWTGTGSVGTVGHGLSSRPELFLLKNRVVGENWLAQNIISTATKYMHLNTTTASTANTSVWNNTEPTSTVITVGANDTANGSGKNIIAYCFHSVDGYSKVGSYTGSGSTDGFVYTGFKPKFVMIKNTTVGNTYSSWMMLDSARQEYNPNDHTKILWANASYAEGKRGNGASSGTYLETDFTSNGFVLKGGAAYELDYSGHTFIYIAFAEHPFKYANAR